jgi:hypothetical protein
MDGFIQSVINDEETIQRMFWRHLERKATSTYSRGMNTWNRFGFQSSEFELWQVHKHTW